MTVLRAQMLTHQGHVFLEVFRGPVVIFLIAQVYVFQSCCFPLKLSINLWITLQLFNVHCLK